MPASTVRHALPGRPARLRAARPGAPARARAQGRSGRRLAPDGRDRGAGAGARHPRAHVRHRRGRGADPVRRVAAARRRGVGGRRTWFLVNGASQGNHVALMTLAHAGNRVVLQRNAHSSTVDALVLSGLRPTFAAPELDPDLHVAHCLRPETLDAALSATPDAVGAAIVSPTYFGAVADVAALAEVAHGHGVPLVVDEAWGAHLAFSDELPAAALSQGADLVISSTHKIVGSLTQSAMVHLGNGDRIDEDVVDRCVTLVESTSPSALLAASLDSAPPRGGRGRAGAAARVAARAGAHPRGRPRGAGARRARRAAGGGGRGVRLRPAAADDRRARDAVERIRAGAAAARPGRRARGAGRRERDGGGVRDGRGHGAGRRAAGGGAATARSRRSARRNGIRSRRRSRRRRRGASW